MSTISQKEKDEFRAEAAAWFKENTPAQPDFMKERHQKQMEKYANRPVTRGTPYEGIAQLREDAKAVADRLVKYNPSE